MSHAESDRIHEALGLHVGDRVWVDRLYPGGTFEGTFRRVLWHDQSVPVALQFDDGYVIPWHAVQGYASDGTDRDGTVAS